MTKKPEDISVQAFAQTEELMTTVAVGDKNQIVLDHGQLKWIRQALHIGLYCIAQVEQLEAQKSMIKSMGGSWPEYLDVRHPGDTDTVRNLADLLIMLDGYDC